MNKDYYKILELQPSCAKEDIKKAFRKLAHIHHPDKGGSATKFKEILEAYQYLEKHHGEVKEEVITIRFHGFGGGFAGTGSTGAPFNGWDWGNF